MAKCTTAPGVLGFMLQRASVRSWSSCHQRVEALRKSSRALENQQPTTYLTGEACEVPQLGASTEKKGLWRLHHLPWMIGVYNTYSRDFQGTQKEQRGHSKLRWTSIPTKNPPPDLKGKAMPGWNPGQSHLQQSHPPGLSRWVSLSLR